MESALTSDPEITGIDTTAAAAAAHGDVSSPWSTMGRVPVTMLNTARHCGLLRFLSQPLNGSHIIPTVQ